VEAVEASLTAPWPHNALSATPDKARPPLPTVGGCITFVDDWNMPQNPVRGTATRICIPAVALVVPFFH
jgi:hypothetical protein